MLDDAPDPEASWLLSRAALQAQDQAAASAALAAAGDYGADHPEAWEPAPYVGAAACVECHASIHRTQQSSRHSQTFRRVPERPALPLPSKPVPDPKDPRVIHELTRTGDRIDATTKISDRSMHDTIAFIMGSGDRAFTLVGRDDDGTFREHRLSYYGRASRWDVTTGHNPHPDNPLEFLGQPQNRDAIHSCLNCHTTDFRATFEQVGPAAADHAIGCERCHGPAGNHLAAVASAFPDQAIGRPRLATSEAVVQLCGQCHGAGKRELPRNDPAFLLRFQATTLPMSKCYTKSGGNLSCITCHSPHRNAETSPAFYEAKCLACHRAEAPTEAKAATVVASHATPTLSDDARRVACPVSPAKGCISCHMPTSMGPMPHSTFTDHQIRVHRDRPAPGSK